MNLLRSLPPVDELQNHKKFTQLMKKYSISKTRLTEWLSDTLQNVRERILAKEITKKDMKQSSITEMIFQRLEQHVIEQLKNNLKPVINATGVVLHTNLGRARLSEQATEQIVNVAKSYSTLEYDILAGRRGSRHDLVEDYLTQLTGAEAAIVVNNNAAAVYLTLRALAHGKEVIVSRGELIEIGGSFRISEIMAESDAILVDVGTTNKTKVKDYEQAITEETALIMKVHKSNFDVIGFSEEVDSEELLSIAKTHSIPVFEDLGSGTLFDFKRRDIGKEPTVQEKVAAGIDLISFSGDKLLGGPQAGIIVGKKKYIDKLKAHQLARVLRVDKFTLAGLEATLKSYVKGVAKLEIPTVRDILNEKQNIHDKASKFLEGIRKQKTGFHFELREDVSMVGGGTMPTEQLPTYVVEGSHKTLTSVEIARKLRNLPKPIIVRIKDEQILLDFRTVDTEEIEEVIRGFVQIEE